MGILIDKTSDCPYINFTEDGILEIEGRSITEDPFSFWQPLLEWVENYTRKPASETEVNIYLEYSNSSSNKYINELLRKLEDSHRKTTLVTVNWRYEEDDESVFQLGKDFESMLKLPFVFSEIEMEKERAKRIKIKNKKSGNEAIITARYWDAIVRNGHGEDYQILQEFS
ncbi:MAG TPA: DUF1987 domain-containing protein [Tenuifilaceae bacterium]|nr:DUF1987 domain-containing protein [Tenuifilaceae bacterium]HOZ14065.1 DUF1987 domain-containing protein [Tenuifilaceae bacterium]HPI44036.1 DUF1987 domain-containing protein [Tenuifilaceae bacterium]HPN21297.1 DUF1987 domain-containing protein [Tenuifilaceae bacterium]